MASKDTIKTTKAKVARKKRTSPGKRARRTARKPKPSAQVTKSASKELGPRRSARPAWRQS